MKHSLIFRSIAFSLIALFTTSQMFGPGATVETESANSLEDHSRIELINPRLLYGIERVYQEFNNVLQDQNNINYQDLIDQWVGIVLDAHRVTLGDQAPLLNLLSVKGKTLLAIAKIASEIGSSLPCPNKIERARALGIASLMVFQALGVDQDEIYPEETLDQYA